VVAPANLISNVLTVSAPTKVTVPNNGQTLTAQIEFVHVPGDPYGDFSSGSCSTWDPNLSVWFDEIEGYNLSVYFYATGLAQLGEYPIGETCICDDDSCFFDLPPVDVQDMPNVTMLVNGSADIGAAVTTVNPVQTVPIQITANGANLTAVALSVTPAGRASLDRYTLNLTNHQPVTVTLTPLAPSQTPYDVQITAIWQNVEVAQASLTIVGAAISRQSLTQFSTSGSPQGGTFSYAAGYLSGSSSFLGEPGIQFSAGVAAQTNPNLAVLSNPANSCANQVPCAGVISAISADYSMPPENQFVLPTTAAGQFNVATFGLSCYYTTAQQQWGAAPDACSTVTIQSVTYSGVASVSPPGLPDGRYCNAFLAELALQGSASLTDGTLVQYSPSLRVVSVITGADGTPVQAGQTIARDRNIIPGIGVLVDINGLGTGLLANDTGGAIRGYRIDYYNGVGPSACSGFSNIMGVSDCNPGNATCPSSTSVVQ
jgi:3D (Asp-Asp-Asp) domain-containing protein